MKIKFSCVKSLLLATGLLLTSATASAGAYYSYIPSEAAVAQQPTQVVVQAPARKKAYRAPTEKYAPCNTVSVCKGTIHYTTLKPDGFPGLKQEISEHPNDIWVIQFPIYDIGEFESVYLAAVASFTKVEFPNAVVDVVTQASPFWGGCASLSACSVNQNKYLSKDRLKTSSVGLKTHGLNVEATGYIGQSPFYMNGFKTLIFQPKQAVILVIKPAVVTATATNVVEVETIEVKEPLIISKPFSPKAPAEKTP
jgi:hypothetical protein